MLKKIIKANLLAVIVGICICNSSYAAFYVGAGAGIRPLAVDFTKFNVLGVRLDNIDLAITKPAVDFSFGYDHIFQNHLYLGGEIFYELADIKQSYDATVSVANMSVTEKVSAKLSNSFGGKVFLGYQTSHAVIFYGDGGLLVDKLYYSASQNIIGHISSTRGNHIAAAAEIGAGMLYPINKRLSLRAEYDYVRYPNIGVNIHVHIPVAGESSVRFTPKASINAVTMAILYRFG